MNIIGWIRIFFQFRKIKRPYFSTPTLQGSSTETAMAKWADLPRDLLASIAKNLETHFDVLNFRSVCTNWRASVPFNSRRRTFRPPFQFHTHKFGGEYFLWERSVCLFEFPVDNDRKSSRFWWVTLEEDEFGKNHLIYPLNWGKRVPIQYPMVLDMSQFHVQELGRQFVQVMDLGDDHTIIDIAAYMNVNDDGFIIMGKSHEPVFINYFNFKDQEWTTVQAEGFTYCLDCIQFESKFYAVDNSGNTFRVEPGSRASFKVGKDLAVRGGYKVLIELCGNLLLAELNSVISPTPKFGFEVFQLDGERKKWDRLESLGDGILVCGEYCKFSAPVIPGVKGNCIVFSVVTHENGRAVPEDLVFDMSSGMTVPLDHHPDLLQLFRPPSFL